MFLVFSQEGNFILAAAFHISQTLLGSSDRTDFPESALCQIKQFTYILSQVSLTTALQGGEGRTSSISPGNGGSVLRLSQFPTSTSSQEPKLGFEPLISTCASGFPNIGHSSDSSEATVLYGGSKQLYRPLENSAASIPGQDQPEVQQRRLGTTPLIQWTRGAWQATSGALPTPGIEPRSPALQADTLPTKPPGKPQLLL